MGHHSQHPPGGQTRTGLSERQQATPILPARLLPLTALDLEVDKQGTVHDIGAVSYTGPSSAGVPRFERRDLARQETEADLTELDNFCQPSRFILGHNLIGHDLPVLRSRYPHLDLLRKPAIDTLYLSPLAFPRNPYHHLVKDYKLVRDTINDPVADAQLSLTVFQEQYAALQQWVQQAPDLLGFYHYCFAHEPHGSVYQGLTEVLRTLVTTPFPSRTAALQGLRRLCRDKACPQQLARITATYLTADKSWIALAYSVGWLQVATGNSILPPWVRHRFPDIPAILTQLREEHCGDSGCACCTANHDPVKHLQRFFPYKDFRETDDGQPLQRELVMAGMAGKSVLGVLPTSGGKSICFQVPALTRYYRRGLLTVIVSPLQALMKDQVDNLRKRTGSTAMAAIYGLLTPPERGAILESVRLGDIGLLYLSPEQLRNRSVIRVLEQREIACWVFDEAHCLSQWGHDFRPDYLYCGRFIRKQVDKGRYPTPPVACFTATAKDDVIDDIRQHFRTTLDLDLEVMNAGVRRDNLEFQVHVVTQAAKYGRVAELLTEHLPEEGSCIVYCATRQVTEEIANFLMHKGHAAEYYHGGLDAPTKKDVLANFVEGRVRVMCATNAFGMGVDKEDVRLVVHAQVPGSLENYLQEAGRSGRDGQDALCILLFDEQDIETQFHLRTFSKVYQRDIQQVLRGIRFQDRRRPGQDIVITPGELLRSEEVNTSFNLTDPNADTKVKTAVAWLERSGFLERNENSTRVFSGKPLFATLDEALQKLDRLRLAPAQRKKWEILLRALINTEPNESLNADYLAEQMGQQAPRDSIQQMRTVEVIDILRQMADAGIVSHGLRMTAFLRPKGRNSAQDVLAQLIHLEGQMLDLLIQAHPDAARGATYPLDLRWLNQAVLDAGSDHCNPQILRNLLKSLATDGQGLADSRASITLKYVYRDNYQITLNRTWNGIRETAKKRQHLAQRILDTLYQDLKPAERSSQGQVLVQFSLQELLEAIRPVDIRTDKQMAALERGLLFLHEQHVIILQQGLAVFRQAMTMKLNPEAHGRRYNKGDYDPLNRHYEAHVTQVHIMNEYAHLGRESMAAALLLVEDYFNRPNVDFLNRYFRGRRDLLELATSQQSLKNIVEVLGNAQQQAIVQAPTDQNILILAGPGAGKTRVVVHRCAYMTRVQRIPPDRLLVLCFNHSAAVTLRLRLQDLLGREAYKIGVYTFHGLAMRLLGNTFELGRSSSGRTEDFNFDDLIPQATALLKGETALPGIPDDQLRASLLSGIQHILVDEYQDIDADQYDMISAIAGRTLSDDEDKLSILAVGDDDQSIYAFRKASVKYIRQFKQDYQAQYYYLVQNYRSTGHIIAAANGLIRHNRDRMKTKQEIRVNDVRQAAPAGGRLAESDPVSEGKVQIIVCPDVTTQTTVTVQELQRLRGLCPDLQWSDCAVLARSGITKSELMYFRAAAEHADIPLSIPLPGGQTLPLFRVREFHRLLDWLNRHYETLVKAPRLLQELDRLQKTDTPWKRILQDLIMSWETETAGNELPASAFRIYLTDYLRQAQREQRFGNGVHMGTVHSSKGMEFRVVVLLDGRWRVKDRQGMEEERRLFYVGMTRAIDSLVILSRQDEQNPHIARIPDTACHERSCAPTGAYPLKQYRTLGMRDLVLGYAGSFEAQHPIHAELDRLNAGDTVEFSPVQGQLLSRGQPIAQLSRKGRATRLPRGAQAIQGRVLALIRRRYEDENENFRKRCRCAEWDIPLVELVWQMDEQDAS